MESVDDALPVAARGLVLDRLCLAAAPRGASAPEKADAAAVDANPKTVIGGLEARRTPHGLSKRSIELSVAGLYACRERPAEPPKQPGVDREDLFVHRGLLTRIGQRPTQHGTYAGAQQLITRL